MICCSCKQDLPEKSFSPSRNYQNNPSFEDTFARNCSNEKKCKGRIIVKTRKGRKAV